MSQPVRPTAVAKRSTTQQQWKWSIDILQGLLAVGLAKLLFPNQPAWEIMALMAMTAGRWLWKLPGGVLMMLAGYTLHNPISGLLALVFGMIGATLVRDDRQIQLVWLMLMPLITAIRTPYAGIVILLTAGLAGMIYGLTEMQAGQRPPRVSKLFRPDSLGDDLHPQQVGEVIATLAQLYQQGLPVPIGWLIYPGDDPQAIGDLRQDTSTRRLETQHWQVRLCWTDDSARIEPIVEDCMGIAGCWAAISAGFETHAGEPIVALIQPAVRSSGGTIHHGIVYCQAPTLKADVPSAVAQRVLTLVEQLNRELNSLEQLAWIDDGVQVWIDRVH
jgi:hypothetical protein